MEPIKVVFEYPENILIGNKYSSFYKLVRTLWFKTATMQKVIKIHFVSGPQHIEPKIRSACNRFGIEFIVHSPINIEFTSVIHRYCKDEYFEKLHTEILQDASNYELS